jgi:hypothetical protein
MGGFSGRQQALQSKARPPSASVTSVRAEAGGINIECEVEPPESPHSLGALATVGARGIAAEFEVAPSAQSSQIFSGDLLPAARNASDKPPLTSGDLLPAASNGLDRPFQTSGDLLPAASNGLDRPFQTSDWPFQTSGDLLPAASNGLDGPFQTSGDLLPAEGCRQLSPEYGSSSSSS